MPNWPSKAVSPGLLLLGGRRSISPNDDRFLDSSFRFRFLVLLLSKIKHFVYVWLSYQSCHFLWPNSTQDKYPPKKCGSLPLFQWPQWLTMGGCNCLERQVDKWPPSSCTSSGSETCSEVGLAVSLALGGGAHGGRRKRLFREGPPCRTDQEVGRGHSLGSTQRSRCQTRPGLHWQPGWHLRRHGRACW